MGETESVVSGISDSRATVEPIASSSDERKGVIGRGRQRSFSSPYSAATLDQIPTPILNVLITLGPYIRYCRKLVQVLAWDSTYSRQSMLLVLLWIAICLWTTQVLTFGVPLAIVYKVCRDWLRVQTARARREKLENEQLAKRQREQTEKERDRNDTDGEYDDDDDDDYYDNDDSERLRRQKSKQYQEEEQELVSRKFQSPDHVSLDDTLHDLAIISDYVDRLRYKLRRLADRLDGSRPDNLAIVLAILMYMWPSWLLSNWFLGPGGILALIGSLALISLSPWFQLAIMAFTRNVLIMHITAAVWAYSTAFVLSALLSLVPRRFSVGLVPVDRKPTSQKKTWFSRFKDIARRNKAEAIKSIKKFEEEEQERQSSLPGTRSEMIFQFEVYENQRWWLGIDWTSNMMPSERGPWTDAQLSPIESKEAFHLPESSEMTEFKAAGKDGEAIKQTIIKTWSWADGDWWVDMTGELQGHVDRNGWEYGNNAWQQMSGQPGVQTFTRRRRWCRRAKLVERRVEEKISAHVSKDAKISSSSSPDQGGLRKRL